MRFRIITKTNETLESIEHSDLEDIFKLSEYLDIQQFLEDTQNKEQEAAQKAQSSMPKF